jgi:hypothetical protein
MQLYCILSKDNSETLSLIQSYTIVLFLILKRKNKMENLKNRADYLLRKCNGDVEFAKKITFNNASLAASENNFDRLDSEATIYHHLKKNKKEFK